MPLLTYIKNGFKADCLYGAVTSITSSYTANNENVIAVDATSGAVTVTLEAASSVIGKMVYVKKVDVSVNAVTIVPTGSDTIDGDTSIDITSQWTCLTFVAAAAGVWYII